MGDSTDGDLEHIEACLSRVKVYTDTKSKDNIQDSGDEYIEEGLGILSDDMDWDGQSSSSGSIPSSHHCPQQRPVAGRHRRRQPDPPPACQYNGASCSCTSDDHVLDTSLPGSSPHHIDTTCAIATVLSLSVSKRHLYVICVRCRFYIPLGGLKKHLKERHKDLLRDGETHTINRDLPPAIRHISDSFGIPLDQKLQTEWTREDFDGPVAGIADPINRIQCPGDGCHSLFVNYEALRSHWRKQACKRSNKAQSSQLANVDTLVKIWAQTPFGFGQSGHYLAIPVSGPLESPTMHSAPQDPPPERPCAEPYKVPTGTDAYRPPWLERIQWAEWRDEQLKRGLSVEQLVAFKALPPPLHNRDARLTGGVFSSPPLPTEIFFWVARRMQTCLERMIADANSWLNSAAGQLRRDLATASVSISPPQLYLLTSLAVDRSKSLYRDVEDQTGYARTMFKIVLISLRIRQHNSGDTPDQVRLKWKLTKRHAEAIDAMLKHIDSTKPPDYLGDPPTSSLSDYDNRLNELLHEMLEATFYTTVSAANFIGCPLDVAIILLSLTDDGSFHKASYVTHFCAIEQHWARTTVVHSLRLYDLDSDKYVSYDPHSVGVGVEDADDEIVDSDRVERQLM